MNIVIHLLALIFAHDGAALARTAPEPMALDDGAYHVAMATIAAERYGVDANLLLSIAAHESHYSLRAQTAEVGGMVSCGVMTPTPLAHCDQGGELGGYDAGARHLHDWLDAAHGDLRMALLGYAGGYRLISACAAGPVSRSTGRHDDLCLIVDVFLWRRDWIRRERSHAPARS